MLLTHCWHRPSVFGCHTLLACPASFAVLRASSAYIVMNYARREINGATSSVITLSGVYCTLIRLVQGQVPPRHPPIRHHCYKIYNIKIIHLTRLWFGHHSLLLSYKFKFILGEVADDTCPACTIAHRSLIPLLDDLVILAT